MPEDGSKVVLITGASSGIGAAIAHEAALRRHRLVLTARRADRLESVAAEARGLGAEALTVPAALDDPDTPSKLVEAAIDRFGGLDVLINNAGLGLPEMFSRCEPDEIRRQVEVNLVAPLVLTRLALPALIERRGTVINIGSAITSVANPSLGAYGATKAGLAYWNDALRREVRHRGVRVCLVEPGPVATEFFEASNAFAARRGGVYNPMSDLPPRALTAEAGEVARRIVRLIDRPRRRLSILKRVVWPNRVIGALFQAAPWLGDAALSAMTRHVERRSAADPSPQGSARDARPAR